jgi:glucokinase
MTIKDLAISIDLGGTQIRAAIINRSGKILARETTATDAQAGADRVTDQIAQLALEVAQAFNRSAIIGAGVASPGPLDTTRGVALSLPTLKGFENYPLRDVLSNKMAMPVMLENDGIAAAIGEWRFGAGVGHDNVVYVTVSTGIGGGVIVDGTVLRGRQGMAGHVGHMSFMANGALCPCGNHGCFEAYGSGTAFTQRAQIFGVGTTAQQVFEMAAQGDVRAQKLVDDEAEILGQGFASLMHLYSPDVLIMGGGMSAQFNVLSPGIVAAQQKSAMPAFRSIPVVHAQLGDNSGLLGAASLVFG